MLSRDIQVSWAADPEACDRAVGRWVITRSPTATVHRGAVAVTCGSLIRHVRVRAGDGTAAGALVLGKRNNRKAKGLAVVGLGGELLHGVATQLVATARCR